MRIIGQAFSTYIILQHGDKLILMDQHAAHERIIFERLKRKFAKGQPMAQMLVAPVVVELTHRELRFLEDEKEFFGKLGFIYDNFGNNSIVLRSIPFELSGGEFDLRAAFLEVVDAAMGQGRADYRLNDGEALYTVACKAAIKANKKLDEIEIKGMLSELARLETPFTCPHGRPTIIEISRHELEKMFKRIV